MNGHRDNKTGIIIGDLETKYADKVNGISFTEAWTTSNHLNGKIELENNLASKYLCVCVCVCVYFRSILNHLILITIDTFFFLSVEGLKLELLTSLLPSANEKTAKVNATYKKPNVHTVATLDVFKVSDLFGIYQGRFS